MIWLHLTACELWLGGPLPGGDCEATSDAFYDGDGDGWGDARLPQAPCAPGAAFAVEAGDCDDLDPDVHPGAIEVCDNGKDDDCDGPNGTHDGLVDCDDADCSGVAGCGTVVETVCDDGVDDDGDGDTDCDDADCAADPACGTTPPPVEICDNGADDDGDGDTDCDDADCDTFTGCDTTGGAGIVVDPPSYVYPNPVYSYGVPQYTPFDVTNTGAVYRTVSGIGLDDGTQSTDIWTLATAPDTPPYGLAGGETKGFDIGCNPTPAFGCGTDDVEVVITTDDPLTPEIRVPVTCSVCS